VSVFLEKFLLPTSSALVVLFLVTNPMKFDWTQRITGGLAIILVAYFVSHTLQKEKAAQLVAAPSTPSTAPQITIPDVPPVEHSEPKKSNDRPRDSESPKREHQKKEEPVNNNQSTTGINSPAILGNNNTVNINSGPQMQPSVEGITLTTRQVPSQRNDAPYAIEVTVQVQANVSPFGLAFIADQPLAGGTFTGTRFSAFSMSLEGTLNEAPDRSYWFHFEAPAVTPQSPLLVTLFAKQPFKIIRAARFVR
jgi:hypothetical protein